MRGPIAVSAPTLVPHRERITADEVFDVVDAAADAGFEALSIWSAHHDWAERDGVDSSAYVEYHRRRRLETPLVEVALDWASPQVHRITESADMRVLEVAGRVEARAVIAACIEPTLEDQRAACANFRLLCDVAADRGLLVSLEFLPGLGVPGIADAVRIIEEVDRDNAGLVIDVWHWVNQPGGPDHDVLASLAPERLHVLQLNDVPQDLREDEILEKTLTGRLLPGRGVADTAALLDAISVLGAKPIVASEVFSSPLLAALGAVGKAQRELAAVEEVLRRS